MKLFCLKEDLQENILPLKKILMGKCASTLKFCFKKLRISQICTEFYFFFFFTMKDLLYVLYLFTSDRAVFVCSWNRCIYMKVLSSCFYEQETFWREKIKDILLCSSCPQWFQKCTKIKIGENVLILSYQNIKKVYDYHYCHVIIHKEI